MPGAGHDLDVLVRHVDAVCAKHIRAEQSQSVQIANGGTAVLLVHSAPFRLRLGDVYMDAYASLGSPPAHILDQPRRT